MLDALVELGLVTRTRSRPTAASSPARSPTRAAEHIAERRTRFEGYWNEALSGFSAAELAVAAAVLDQIATMFEGFDGSPSLDSVAQPRVRAERQELRHLVAERDLGEERLRLRRAASTRVELPAHVRLAELPDLTQLHTCEREISAVATSSIRLSIAAAPIPCSHASR